MSIFYKLKLLGRILTNKDFRFNYYSFKGKYDNLSDEEYLCRKYRAAFHRELNLDNPQLYNEKLQWLKLYDRRPEYTAMVDKYEVKKYVSEKIGEEYIIPTLGIWEQFDDIDFDTLPEQFVLKCTHDSGGIIICQDKNKLDIKAARQKINKSLKKNYYYSGREFPYKNIPKKIIAEKYMIDEYNEELRDYKFFCFNDEPKIMFVATDRQTKGEEVKFDFFDMNYNHIDLRQGHPNAKKIPEKPVQFDKMKELAKVLSKDIPHVRVDFYEVNGSIYFGELTFFHFNGMVPFKPEEWDYTLGSWLELPQKSTICK